MMRRNRRSSTRTQRHSVRRIRQKGMQKVRTVGAPSSLNRRPTAAKPFALNRTAAAVVVACNEEAAIAGVLYELKRLPLQEIIVVLNGCSDRTYYKVMEIPGVLIVNIPEKLGYDVGRGVGARLSTADCILFVDGDIVIPAEELYPFLSAIDHGYDVALNHLQPLLPPFKRQDIVTRCKVFLNRLLKRTDLGSNSMTAIPHALSRRGLEEIGAEALAVPPLAQAMAILKGMKVVSAHTVDVLTRNRRRHVNEGKGNAVEGLIVGDHAEALAYVMSMTGRERLTTPQTITRAELARRRNGLFR